ncbi:MAG: hypothetical protein IPP13_21655 [Kouleothrix sp.]|jgi:hypothetical protein|nr:hypothetical protein [Kouleothrix sp.]
MISYTTRPTYYDNAQQLLAEDDHIEMDVNVEGWLYSLRIRSLTVPQRNRINSAAGVGKDRDWTVFHARTIAEGLVRPRLNPTQACELAEAHNGALVEELSEAIWSIGSLFKLYQAYMDELKKLNAAKEQLPDE